MSDIQKVLVFDIETSPILAYVWGLRDQNISLNQIKEDWHIMAWAAKWLGDPVSKIMYADKRKSDSDRPLLDKLWHLLDKAAIVVTQNGKNFDSRKLNARFIELGMKPPSPYKHLDTYRIAKDAAEFTSHKLEYLTEHLCTNYKKLSHKKYPGMSLWTECLKGNNAAWDEMKKYNIHDVLSTEELYLKLRAWVPQSAPHVYTAKDQCSVCGSNETEHRGKELKRTGWYQRIHCLKCGKWTTEAKLK